ncbi:hypothetical protein RS24_00144 [Candidatus Micropelagos thuwalensis]|uniref:ATPase n=1 Tax=Candidatus Micropelagius thuwalensis TaxID=1397666 RepID=U2XWK4_9PROT|nr:division plane positioning ATPase MipZ [Candidatus Micropelagos thuwalensis]ERL47226.1 hypothetical protein RS24_00144 [Candidatus Micropelagos thuwalensis]MEC7176168.1 division plane positioning ATPase MipZ [Pseudomonadota bacterium]
MGFFNNQSKKETVYPYVIVVGNEKGGSGKTTTAMHIMAALLDMGFSVGSLDIDSRQKSLSRYIENRQAWSLRSGRSVPMPEHQIADPPFGITIKERQDFEQENFLKAMSGLRTRNQFVIVDSPGSDTYLSRLAHASADTLITPINDSFVDFDLLGKVDPDTLEVLGPSIYSDLVWECRKARMQADNGKIDWVVLRNRYSHVYAKNRKRVEAALQELSGRSHFRLLQGLSERVIFREMYPAGLTLLDLTTEEANTSLTISHVAARAEIFNLIQGLNLPGVKI